MPVPNPMAAAVLVAAASLVAVEILMAARS
jgi:hypothetical protein